MAQYAYWNCSHAFQFVTSKSPIKYVRNEIYKGRIAIENLSIRVPGTIGTAQLLPPTTNCIQITFYSIVFIREVARLFLTPDL